MSRPMKCRRVGFIPDVLYFKPAGIPVRELDEIGLSLDELESVRLADLEGLYQEDAAANMCVSRQTFANILASAHSKIAECLIQCKALRIEGGKIDTTDRNFICGECSHTWSITFGSKCPQECPNCQCQNISRVLAGNNQEKEISKGCARRKRCCRKNTQEETS